MGANALGQAANILIQVVTVPWLVTQLGTDRYADWLVLSAVPSFLALSDLGFASAATSEMTMLVARAEKEKAQEVYGSLLGLTLVTCATLLCLLALLRASGSLHFVPLLGLRSTSEAEAQSALTLLLFYVAVNLLAGMSRPLFQCDGRFALGVHAWTVTRVLDAVAVLLSFSLSPSLALAALLLFLTRIFSTLFLLLLGHRLTPWLSFSLRGARRETLRRLTAPALSSLGFPLGHALNSQGLLTLASHQLSGGAVLALQADHVFAGDPV